MSHSYNTNYAELAEHSDYSAEELATHDRQARIVLADALEHFKTSLAEAVHERTDLMTERTEAELDAIAAELVERVLGGADPLAALDSD